MKALYRAILSIALVVMSAYPAWDATYYVATTGNDSSATPTNPATPWRNPTRCTLAPVVAGDTCMVANGIYTDPSATATDSFVIRAYGSVVSGTSGNPITIKSTNLYGAKLLLGSGTCNSPSFCQNVGMRVGASWYTFDGFEIYQTSSAANGSGVANHGATVVSGTGIRFINNYVHDIGRNVCSSSGSGFTGFFIGAQNAAVGTVTLQGNILGSIGRLRGVAGFQEINPATGTLCTLTAGGGGLDQNDHAMYIDAFGNGLNTITIARNLCYDTTRGYCLQFYSGSPPAAMTTTVHVWNNTFDGGTPETFPPAQVTLSSPITNIDFKNNIYYRPKTTPFTWSGYDFSTRCVGVTYDHELTDNADVDMFSPAPTGCITSGGNNLVGSSTINFTNAAARDYSLAAGSAAINSGVNVGLGGCNGVCDRGYLESGGGADVTAPTTPGIPVVTPVSSSQLTLAWSASTDNVAVTGYRIERCTGAGCSNFVQIGTSVSPIYADSGLLSSIIYLYRVRATDAAGNLSAYSPSATASLTPPSTPTGLLISSIH